MNGARAAGSAARLLVGLAARALPAPDARERYRSEFLAELHDLPPLGQLAHSLGVLSQVFALRAALVGSSSVGEELTMTLTAHRAPWQCRFLRLHHWVMRSTEDGERYQACSLCGEDRGPAALGMSSTPPWPGDL